MFLAWMVGAWQTDQVLPPTVLIWRDVAVAKGTVICRWFWLGSWNHAVSQLEWSAYCQYVCRLLTVHITYCRYVCRLLTVHITYCQYVCRLTVHITHNYSGPVCMWLNVITDVIPKQFFTFSECFLGCLTIEDFGSMILTTSGYTRLCQCHSRIPGDSSAAVRASDVTFRRL
jgi:hypothetical protein